jgi:hypothetical protein
MAKDTVETGLPPEVLDALRKLERTARLMDTSIRIPVIGYRIGLDGLVGLVPGIGDALTLAPALYILFKARQIGVPAPVLLRMAGNTGIDALLGTVPLIGDLFDMIWKSNLRNVDLVREHLERERRLSTINRA